jgi:Zn-dependent oligopeptidase
MSLRFLAAALVAGFALSLAPTAPAVADEDPVVRQPRARVAAPYYWAVRYARYRHAYGYGYGAGYYHY